MSKQKKIMIRRVRVTISGRVQKVFYRDYTKRKADQLGIKGWVRNTPDDKVEALFQGPGDQIEEIVKWCWQGSVESKVTRVELTEEKPPDPLEEEFGGFEIRD